MSVYIRITRGRNAQNPTFLAELARQRGWGLVNEVCDLSFEDVEGKEFKSLQDASRRGEIDILCVCGADRNLGILRSAVGEMCRAEGFYLDSIDTPRGRLMFNLLSAVVQYEKEMGTR